MLPRKSRLSPKEAEKLRKKVSSDFFSLRFSEQKSGTPKFLVIVGSKVHSSAVLRNRLKRRVRGALANLTIKSPDGILVALPPAGKLDGARVQREIHKLLQRT